MQAKRFRILCLCIIFTLCFSMVSCDLASGGILGELLEDLPSDLKDPSNELSSVLEQIPEDTKKPSTEQTYPNYELTEPLPGTAEPPVTEPPKTEPPKTEPPTTNPPKTEPPTTAEPTIDPVMLFVSFDELYMCINGERYGEFFAPGQSADWKHVAKVEDYTIEHIVYRGWVAFFAEQVGYFGYQIDDGEPVFDDAFATYTEQPVLDAAAGIGAKSASRMEIGIPVRDLSGSHIIRTLVMDEAGTIEVLTEFTLQKALDPYAPVVIVPAADMASTIPGSPGINSATLSQDRNYVTIDTIGQGDPYYQLPMMNGKGYEANYVAIKYRSTSDFQTSEMFVGSGAGPCGQGDNIRFELTCDGKWQLAIVDLSQASAVVDGIVNYLRWDCFAGVGTAPIDLGYVALFNSPEAALEYDQRFADNYVDTYNVPISTWTVSGHCSEIVSANGQSLSGMIAAGGVEYGALLHQGYISLGNVNLAQMSKVVIYYGIDGSQVTIDLHAANPQNRIMLTSADQAMTNSPTDDVIIAAADYYELGWAVHAIEIDLTGVDYNGPVYVTYDTLPGSFMLISSVEFTYDPYYVEPEEPENGSIEAPLSVTETLNAVMDLQPGQATDVPYFTTGTVSEIGQSGSYYKNVYITDGESTMLIYTLNPMEGMSELRVGDTVTVNGYIKNYNGTIEFASYRIDDVMIYVYVVDHKPAFVEPEKPESDPNATIPLEQSPLNAYSFDTILLNGNFYFGSDGNALGKLEEVGNTLYVTEGDVLHFRGWAGFAYPIESFGYQINGGDIVWGDFKIQTESAILAVAGQHASRYAMSWNTWGAASDVYTISLVVRLQSGISVELHTFYVSID